MRAVGSSYRDERFGGVTTKFARYLGSMSAYGVLSAIELNFRISCYSSTIEDAGQQHLCELPVILVCLPALYCVIRCASWIHQAVVET